MYYSEHGAGGLPTVILLHGAFFTEAFGRQYVLSDRYHLVVPHIKGFGRAAAETFTAQEAAAELKELAAGFGGPVYLIGFSLGAQLGFKLLAEAPSLFRKAILVSPWLLHKDDLPAAVLQENLKLLHQLQNPVSGRLIALANGLPKAARKEFAESMQLVSETTVRNCVDNGISIDTEPDFAACPVPMLALAGEKEPADIQASARRLAELNENCRCEIWEKAGHNIPPLFARRFNERVTAFFGADD